MSNYPPGVTGAETYLRLPDDMPPATCYECGTPLADIVTGQPGAAICHETTNLCRSCHGCDETCVAFVRCYVCGTLTQGHSYSSGGDGSSRPRCVEYFACARRKDESDAT